MLTCKKDREIFTCVFFDADKCVVNIYHVVEEETIRNVRMLRANIQALVHEMHTESQSEREGSTCECNFRRHLTTMKVLKAKGKRIGMAQLRENRRKRCSHTKEFWVRKGQCALPHVDVLRQKGLAPDILLGPCCLWATRGVAIKWSILRITMSSPGYIRTVNRTLEINLNFRPHRTLLLRALWISYRKQWYWLASTAEAI